MGKWKLTTYGRYLSSCFAVATKIKLILTLNKDILMGFIKDLHGIRVKDVIIETPYCIEEFNRYKSSKGYFETEVDSFCIDENNFKFTAEMQIVEQYYYPERSLYYLVDKYRSTYGRKDLMRNRSKYSALYPTYSMNILGYIHFENDNKALHFFSLYDAESGAKFSEPDLITLGFFELKKEDTAINENVKHWRDYFINGHVGGSAPSYIRHAVDVISVSKFSKEERVMIDAMERASEDAIARELFFWDKIEKIEKKAQEAEKQAQFAEEKGRLEGQKKLISLLKQGHSLEEIEKLIDND